MSLILRTRSRLSRLRIVLGERISRLRIVLRREVFFCGLIAILFRGGLFLTNNSSEFSLIVLSVK